MSAITDSHEFKKMEEMLTRLKKIIVGPVREAQVTEQPETLAFPSSYKTWENGLTKREWFAGLALQSLIEKSGAIVTCNALPGETLGTEKQRQEHLRANVLGAVDYADALIKELEK